MYELRVNFADKLKKIVADGSINKSKASRDAGLPESTISSYLAKPDSLPRIDIALKLARALKVPLEWLSDDEQDWPPPQISQGLAAVPDHELMAETSRRLVNVASRVAAILQRAKEIDWPKTARAMLKIPVDAPLPEEFEPVLRSLYLLRSTFDDLSQFDASKTLYMHAPNPPKIDDLRERVSELLKDDPDVTAAAKYADLRELARALERHGGKSSDRDLEGHRQRILEVLTPNFEHLLDTPPAKKSSRRGVTKHPGNW